jgi:hypothetical protein
LLYRYVASHDELVERMADQVPLAQQGRVR